MEYVKTLGLAAVAATALMALLGAGSASATVLCSTYMSPCPVGWNEPAGTEIDMTLKAGTSQTIFSTGGTLVETCTTSTFKGKTTNAGSATETIKGNVEKLTFENCGSEIKVVSTGAFEIHYVGPTTKGGLTTSGTHLTVVDFGVSCDYFTGSSWVEFAAMESDESISPEANVESVFTKEAGGFLCPGSVVIGGHYLITKPTKIFFKKTMEGEA
jgi:hypothetical protein